MSYTRMTLKLHKLTRSQPTNKKYLESEID